MLIPFLVSSSDGLKSCCGLESSKSFWWILDIVEFFLVCAAKPDFKKLFLSWPLGRHAHQKVTRFPGKFCLYVTFGLWYGVLLHSVPKMKKSSINKNACRNFSLSVYLGRSKCWCFTLFEQNSLRIALYKIEFTVHGEL